MRVPRLGQKQFVSIGILLAVVVCASSLANAASYKAAFLTADQAGVAPHTDPNLINPWGISFSSSGPFWVANNNSGTSTIYDGTGTPNPLVVTIPPVGGATSGTPTGTVFNGTTGFVVTKNGHSAPAAFLFDSEDGSITGWSPTVDATNAVVAVDNSGANAVYKAMELANNGTGDFLYVCNFFSAKIEVYNNNFVQVNLAGSFTDPNLPLGFAPHNIRNIGGQLWVAYAKQNATKTDAVFGPGLGLVSIFDFNGNFIKRFATRGRLNAPWGLALAPATFGTFANDVLIGNLGDGKITAYDPVTKLAKGQLSNAGGGAIVLKGLWALTFGNGGSGGSKDILYFTSGPGAYAHGRFGSISFVP